MCQVSGFRAWQWGSCRVDKIIHSVEPAFYSLEDKFGEEV